MSFMKFGIPALLCASAMIVATGCGSDDDEKLIRVEGSDTMVNLAVEWSETYMKKHEDVDIEVSGNGSGTGIKALVDGEADLCDASRVMEDEEKALVKEKRGADAVEHVVAYDALAVYVHKDSPLDSISLEELGEIYADGGTITSWKDVTGGDAIGDKQIQVVNRQNSSGTRKYFQKRALNKRKYRAGTLDQSGSKDVVNVVGTTPTAIGYAGMGYFDPNKVKMLSISVKKGEPGVEPTLENAQNGSYPITRPLYIYTAGEPEGVTKDYLNWIKSSEGQAIVKKQGYIPISE